MQLPFVFRRRTFSCLFSRIFSNLCSFELFSHHPVYRLWNANKENGSTLKECRHFRQRIRRCQSRIYWRDRVISPERTLGFIIRHDTFNSKPTLARSLKVDLSLEYSKLTHLSEVARSQLESTARKAGNPIEARYQALKSDAKIDTHALSRWLEHLKPTPRSVIQKSIPRGVVSGIFEENGSHTSPVILSKPESLSRFGHASTGKLVAREYTSLKLKLGAGHPR